MYFNEYVNRCCDSLCDHYLSKSVKCLGCLDCYDDYLQDNFEEELFSMDNNGFQELVL